MTRLKNFIDRCSAYCRESKVLAISWAVIWTTTRTLAPIVARLSLDGFKSFLLCLLLLAIFYLSAFHGYRQEVIVYGPGKLHLRNLIQEKQFFLGSEMSMKVWFEEADNAADVVPVISQGVRHNWRGFGHLWRWQVEEEIPFME